MNERIQPKISIWRAVLGSKAPDMSGKRAVERAAVRLPIANLTAGQGKIRLAG